MKYFLILFIILISFSSHGQALEELINHGNFIIEANEIRDGKNVPRLVAPGLNFISIDGDKIIIQWEDNYGNNGVGGFTQVGKIYKQQIKKKYQKNGWKYISKIKCNTLFEKYEVILSISYDGQATAYVKRSHETNQQFKLYGNVKSHEFASVIVGQEQRLESYKDENDFIKDYNSWKKNHRTPSETHFIVQ